MNNSASRQQIIDAHRINAEHWKNGYTNTGHAANEAWYRFWSGGDSGQPSPIEQTSEEWRKNQVESWAEKQVYEEAWKRLDNELKDKGFEPSSVEERNEWQSNPPDVINPGDYGDPWGPLNEIAGDKLKDFLKDQMQQDLNQSGFDPKKTKEFQDAIDKILRDIESLVTVPSPFNEYIDYNQQCVPESVNADFIRAHNNPTRYDPLVLDLDEDGIETTTANGGVLFDMDGDGKKTGIGWIKPDDGFLVFDKNNNGLIENGTELFGVDTIKRNGQKATSGFDALNDIDNNQDGFFDSSDSAFYSVKVWRDKNQDGISQSDELKALPELKIKSIHLGSENKNTLINGNIIRSTGYFEFSDGHTGTVSDRRGTVADLDLSTNPFYREFAEKINVTNQTASLPIMRGSGAVRDLREAAGLSPKLAYLLAEYSNTSDSIAQYQMLDSILEAWAESSGFTSLFKRIDESDQGGLDVNFSYSWESSYQSSRNPTPEDLEKKMLLERISILEAFNGTTFFKITPRVEGNGLSGSVEILTGNTGGNTVYAQKESSSGLPVSLVVTERDISLSPGQVEMLSTAYKTLRNALNDALTLQVRLKKYTDAVTFSFGFSGVIVNYEGALTGLNKVYESSPIDAVLDGFALDTAIRSGSNMPDWLSMVANWVSNFNEAQIKQLKERGNINVLAGTDYSDSILGADGNNIIYGNEGDDILNGNQGRDVLVGGGGRDHLSGGAGNDSIYGGDGSDNLYGENGRDHLVGGDGDDFLDGGDDSDIIVGGEGRDKLYGGSGNDEIFGGGGVDNIAGGEGDDFLDGGAGDDFLEGGAGNDTYVFGKGSGNDNIIISPFQNTSKNDVVRIKDLKSDDVVFRRLGYNNTLEIRIKETGEYLTIEHYFTVDSLYQASGAVAKIYVGDFDVWDLERVKAHVQLGTAGGGRDLWI